jgi:hypothetical protein
MGVFEIRHSSVSVGCSLLRAQSDEPSICIVRGCMKRRGHKTRSIGDAVGCRRAVASESIRVLSLIGRPISADPRFVHFR